MMQMTMEDFKIFLKRIEKCNVCIWMHMSALSPLKLFEFCLKKKKTKTFFFPDHKRCETMVTRQVRSKKKEEEENSKITEF